MYNAVLLRGLTEIISMILSVLIKWPQLLIVTVFCRLLKIGHSFQEFRVQYLKLPSFVNEDVICFYS